MIFEGGAVTVVVFIMYRFATGQMIGGGLWEQLITFFEK